MPTSVSPVEGRSDLKRFIEYPFSLYANDPLWVPPLLIGEWERFDPKRNPFFEHARMQLFLAWRDGRIVGRVAGIDDDNHNRTHGDNLAFFGFFEAADSEAAALLLREVENWARRLGRDAVRGPANPSMNDGSGFQIDAFDTSPFILMPYNPPEYPKYMEELGYAKAKDLYAWLLDLQSGVTDRLHRLAERVRKRTNPTIRPANMKRFDDELVLLKRFFDEAWEKNWGFVKYTDAEFAHLAKELKLIIDPDSVLIAELDGRLAGIALGLPDINQVLKRIHGRLLPFGILTLLRRKSIITQGRLPILGVMPEFRNRGIELVLIDQIAQHGKEIGYQYAECSWVLEDNHAMNEGIRATGCSLYKTYRLFEKPLRASA